MEELLLPFHLDVPLRSFLDVAVPISLLHYHPLCYNVAYSFNISVFFASASAWNTKVFRIVPTLDRSAWERLGLLHVLQIDSFKESSITDSSALISAILSWVENNEYVECRLNEFWMPCRPLFMRQHFDIHMNIITGFSRRRQVFFVAGYGRSYELSELSFADFSQAFYSAPEPQFRGSDSQFPWWKVLWRWTPLEKPANELHPFPDLSLIQSQLSAYLDGSVHGTPEVFARSDRQYEMEAGTWGLNTYESWRIYIDWVRAKRERIDLRATRTLSEHKLCMYNRVLLLRKIGVVIADDVVKSLSEVQERAQTVALQAIGYNRTSDCRYLTTMAESLVELRRMETLCLPELLRALAVRAAASGAETHT